MVVKPNKKGTVVGTVGNDKITFQNSKEWNKNLTIYAGEGSDIVNLKKSSKRNKIYGENGNDTVYGGSGIDYIYGDEGNDKLYGYAGNDIIYGGNGNDVIDGGLGNDKLYGQDGNDTIKGGAGNDVIDGGADNDKLYGNDGNDTIKGGTGDDIIDGGSGNDKLYGQDGNDTIKGGAGDDVIDAGSGNDTIYGTSGKNTLKGGAGNDKIYGGTGNDVIYAGSGDDYINAGKGVNTLYFGKNEGYNTVVKGGGTDTIYFNKESNIKNVKYVYSGYDLILTAGGTSVVLKNYKKGHSAQYIQVGKIKKTIKDFVKTATVTPVVPQPTPTAPPAPVYNTINGSPNNDYLIGTTGADRIYGYEGDDDIDSYLGNDIINGGPGNNWMNFYPGDGNDVIENGGGTDYIWVSGLITQMAQNGNDLVITYGYGDTITVQNYYLGGHSVKYIQSANSGETVTIAQMFNIIQNGGSVPVNPSQDDNTYQKIKFNNNDANILFAKAAGTEGNETTIGNTGTNYVYADDNGSIIKGGSGTTHFLGGKGDDKFYGGSGNEYFMGGAGNNEFHISANGGQDTISLSATDENNTIIFEDIEFTVDGNGKVTALGNLILTDRDTNNNRLDTLYIKGYGTSSDYIQAPNYFYTGDGYKFYYEGYTLQDKNGNKISLSDAVKMSVNREADTDYTVGKLSGNSTNETFYTNSTVEGAQYVSASETANGSVNAGAGNDTIYSGGIYQHENGLTSRPVIYGGDGDDIIRAEGNKIYFTTSRTDLQYSDQNLIAIQTHQTNGNTTTTTVYDSDHIYITPDNKVMTGYFFFAYEFGQDAQGSTTVQSIQLDASDKYEYIGSYYYTDAGMNVYVYHTDELMNSKIEGKKTYFFDYGAKVASGQVTVNGDAGDDTIYIGNGSTAYGGEGNDNIIGNGLAYGGEGNDKIILNNDNYYLDGLGFTYYYANGGKGNDYVDFSEVINREHEAIELSSGTVEYDTYIPEIEFSEGINTLVLNPKDDREIAIDMSEFAPVQRDTSRWYLWHHVDTDTQFGTFQRGDDLYLVMNDSSNKNGTLIIKDYFAVVRDENGQPILDEHNEEIRVFSKERRESIKIMFEPSLRYDGYNTKPQSYMSLEKFIGYANGTEVTDEYGYYNLAVSGNNYKNSPVNEKNAYFTFIDNNVEGATINGEEATPTFTHKEYVPVNNGASYEWTEIEHKGGYYIIGGDGAQTIYGGDGDDVIFGDNLGSHDADGNWVDAQNGGNDKIYAGQGDDYIEGGDGDDLIDGGDGQNIIYGGKGDDTIIAGNPDSELFNAKSVAYGGDGEDTIYAQAVLNDGLVDEAASKTYLGGETNRGRQYLYGGAGADTIIANGYSATVEAGAGNDTVYYYNNNGLEYAWWNGQTSTISLGEGNDQFYAFGNGAFLVEANSGNNLIDASGSSATGNYIYGGTGNDTIYGGSGKDIIVTGLGNAVVYAGGGDDEITSGNNDYYSMNDVHMQTEVHGGEGNDTISVSGKSIIYGDAGNDIISLDGDSKYVPSALTIDGGAGDDIYRGYGTSGVNTLIASSGADKIQFLGVQVNAFNMSQSGNDLVISTTRTYDGKTSAGLTVLKDYYLADKQALFNNWTVETYTSDINGPKRNTFTMPEFVNYISGQANIISSGIGTEGNDYIETSNDVIVVNAKGGNDNIVGGDNASYINGGAGSDYIITSDAGYEGKQIILGDSGTATVTDNGEIIGTSNVSYTINYTPSADNSGNDIDTIISYGERSYIWGEGGNDNITLMRGTQNHVWGGSGNDTITAVFGSAQQIYGGDGEDTIKARASFIDGGADNDTIIHKFGGYSSSYTYDSYDIHKNILKTNYSATDEWVNKLVGYYDENSIYFKSSQVSSAYQNAASDKNYISNYEYIINFCETNGYKYYGQISVNDWRKYLADAKIRYYGSKSTYENLEEVVTATRDADITANNLESLNGVKGSKDLYIDTMLSTTSTQEDKVAAKATYEHDQLVVKTYQEFVDKFDDLTYSGWDYANGVSYNFRDEGDKAYWENKLAQAKLTLDGVMGTQTAYNNLHALVEYSAYINNQNKLNNYQTYYNILNNGGSSSDYTGPTFTDISKDSWYNKADLLKDNIQGCVGSKTIYENLVASGTATEEELADALAAYKRDEYLYDLYSTYYEFYFDEEFNDPNYANHTLMIKNDGTTSAYVSFRDEAEQCYSTYYDGSPSAYWSRMASLVKNRMDGCQGTQAIETEMYARYIAGGLPHSSFTYWRDINEHNIDEYNECSDFYNNYENPTNAILQEYSAYFGNYTKDNLQSYITKLNSYINGSGTTYETLKSELDAMVAQFKQDAPSNTALKLIAHLQDEIVLGGSGNDTITLGHVDNEDEYFATGRVFAMGEEGNDTYIIDSLTHKNYNGEISSNAITIQDTEDTNTIKFNSEDLKSGNVGMYLNVTLRKNPDGSYQKDVNGNYEYDILNFGTSYTSKDNVSYNLSNTPLYDGDAGYSVVFVDNETFKETNNQFNYGGLIDQAGIKFDTDTLNHVDYIWSADGKYITRTQINAAAQNTANWLGQYGFGSFMEALDNSDAVSDRAKVLNELRNFENLGSLEWITPNVEGHPDASDIITPATEGLTGTNTNDELTFNSAPVGENNVIDLKYGNDKVTFEGEFGDYIIQSSSTKDNDNVARQTDTISLAAYSVTDGSIKFSQSGNDLVITAYNGENKVGSVTYKGFLASDYSLRSFVLVANDNDYLVSKETASMHVNAGSNLSSISIRDDEDSYNHIKFVEGIDDNNVYLSTNGNRAYYYTLNNTPLALRSIKEGEPVEIFSQGNSNDSYSIGLTAQTNITIHDAGGTNEISIGNAHWDGSGAVTDSKFRLFFDIDENGIVSDTKHLIWQEKFKPYEDVLVKHGTGENAYYTNEKSYYYDTDNLLKLLNGDSDHMLGALTFDGEIRRIQTDDRYDHNDRLVYAEDVDDSILPEKYIRGIATDVVPWLKLNGYTSVSNALSTLRAEIISTQELMEDVAVDSDEFTAYSTAIATAQGKIDKLLGYFNIGYGEVLMKNLYGTEGNDTLEAASYWSSYTTNRIEGDKGDDVINVNGGTVNEGTGKKIIYSFDRGDGHDTLIEARQTETIYVDKADKTMFTKLRTSGWDLILEFYSDAESTENPDGSITLKDYFKENEDYRVDNLVIQSTGNADEELSIKTLLSSEAVINRENVYISTENSDNIPASANSRYIYIGNGNYDTNDVIANSSGNDEIYISNDRADTTVTYTVNNGGDDIIAGSFWKTGLVIDYANTHAQTEYRKIGDDMKMLFFMGDGDAKHKVGSITFKDYYHWSTSKIGDSISIDYSNFIMRTGGVDTKVNSVTLLEEYRLAGGNLDFDDTQPFFAETVATNGAEIAANSPKNTLVFTGADSFRDLSFAVNNDGDLVITNTKTDAVTTIKGYTSGHYAINHIRIGNIVKDINENKVIPTYDDLGVPVQENSYTNIDVANDATTVYGTYNNDYIEIPSTATNITGIYTKADGGSDSGNDIVIVGKNDNATINNATIETYDKNDIIEITGHGNTIKGGYYNDIHRITTDSNEVGEENIIEFTSDTAAYDVVENCSGNILLYLNQGYNVTLEKFGDDLFIKYYNGNSIVNIRGYFDEVNGSNKDANFTIKVGYNTQDAPITLAAYIENYITAHGAIPDADVTTMTTTNHFTTGYDDIVVLPNNLANPITSISSGGGNDVIDVEIDDATIDGGSGNDTITVTGSGNTLRGDKGVDVFNVYAENAEDINTIIFDENSQNSGDKDIVNAVGGKVKLNFAECWISDLTLARKDDYLVIRYYGNQSSVYIKDYFNNEVNTADIILIAGNNNYEISLDDFITQNYSSTTGLFEVWGTEENDKFIHEILDNTSVTYNLGKGNDVLEFVNIPDNNKDNITRKAIVNSEGVSDTYHITQNKDKLIMNAYSGYSSKLRYGFGNDGDITVTAIQDNNYNNQKKIVSEVTYKDFLNKDANGNWKTANLEVEDYGMSTPEQVKRYDIVQNLDTYRSYLTQDSNLQEVFEKVGAIYIKADSGISNITDDGGYAQILTDGGAGLYYEGSNGRIITNSTSSNDKYCVSNTYSSGGTTYITDMGGTNDELMITEQFVNQYNNSLEYLYLSFNIDKYGNMGDTFVLTSTASSSLQITNGAQYLSGQYESILNNNIVITAARTDAQVAAGTLGIETVSAYQKNYDSYYLDANGVYRYNQIKIADIDMTSWCNDIRTQVVTWLNNNGFDSTDQVFGLDTNNDENYQLYSSLCALYDAKNASMYTM